MRLWLGNFDFEHQLAVMRPETRSYQASTLLDRINAELSPGLALIAAEADAVWFPWKLDPDFRTHLTDAGLAAPRFLSDVSELADSTRRQLEVAPWGWSRAVQLWCERHDCACEEQLLSAAFEVNSRAFSAHLESAARVAPPWSRFVHDLEEFEAIVSAGTGPSLQWVVKAAYGMSARERIVFSEQPRPNELAWIRKQFNMGHGVLVEPWLEAIAEVSFQFEVRGPADVECLGLTQLVTDARGRHVANRVSTSRDVPDMWTEAVPHVTQAAQAVAARRYRGPLGIDVMCFRDPETGTPRLRPIQDLNARLTMGRLALGLSPLLQDGEWASWCHLRCPSSATLADAWRELRSRLPASTRVLPTSPSHVDDRPLQMITLALIDSDYYALLYAESQAAAAFRPRSGALLR